MVAVAAGLAAVEAADAAEGGRAGSREAGTVDGVGLGVGLVSRTPPNPVVPNMDRDGGWVVAGLPGLVWPIPKLAASGRATLPPLGVRRCVALEGCPAAAAALCWSNGEGSERPPIEDTEGNGRFGRCVEPVAEAELGKGDGLVELTGEADAAGGNLRLSAVGDGADAFGFAHPTGCDDADLARTSGVSHFLRRSCSSRSRSRAAGSSRLLASSRSRSFSRSLWASCSLALQFSTSDPSRGAADE